MTTNSNRTTFSRVSLSCLSIFVAVASLSTNALISSPAQAAPAAGATCSITTYYSDPDKTNQVGTYSNCPGGNRGLHGRRTSYYDVETLQYGDLAGGNSGEDGGKGLPCEFTAITDEQKGVCYNLPTARPGDDSSLGRAVPPRRVVGAPQPPYGKRM